MLEKYFFIFCFHSLIRTYGLSTNTVAEENSRLSIISYTKISKLTFKVFYGKSLKFYVIYTQLFSSMSS